MSKSGFFPGVLFLVLFVGFLWTGWGFGSSLDPAPLPAGPGVHDPYIEKASVSDLKRSEKYLRKDFGLEGPEENSALPLWQQSLYNHPFMVVISAMMVLGGSVAFFIIYRRQSKTLREGLELARENEGRLTGSYGTSSSRKPSIQEVIAKEALEIGTIPSIPDDKVPAKVDNVLDSLRFGLGYSAGSSRISLFRYDEGKGQFWVCGFSKGEDFKIFNPLSSPPAEVFSSPIRTLTPFVSRRLAGKDPSTGWVFPFVTETGDFCVLILEMNQGQPPQEWIGSVLGSLDLVKALIAKQSSAKEDVTLTTQDASGSLDFRATMNRLLEEWNKVQKMGIPFTVIILKINNLDEMTRFYGAAPMEAAWSRLVILIKSILRPSDWVMRPEGDMIVIQLLEAGPSEGPIVLGRIRKEFRKYEVRKTLSDKPVHYRGVMMSYPVDSAISVNSFFEQILKRFDDRIDFEGDLYLVR